MKKSIIIGVSAIALLCGLSIKAYYGESTQPSGYGFAPAAQPMHGSSYSTPSSSTPSYTNTYSYPYTNSYNNSSYANSYGSSNSYGNSNTYSQPKTQPQQQPTYSVQQQVKPAETPVVKLEARKTVDYISTPNSTNSSVKFFYYIPVSLLASQTPYPVITWVPGLDGDGEESVPGELYDLADKKGYAILSPTFKFNENDFNQNKSYQYPQAWSGKALVDMLDKAKEHGLNYSKLYMVGFSAGAQFSSRFSFMKPEMVDACALLGSGARVQPDRKTNVKYFIGIGTQDTEYRQQNAEIFYNAAQKLNIPIVYNKYNIEHDTNEAEFNDVVEFFEKVRNNSL